MPITKGVDGERIENNLLQMHRDLNRGKFTLEELKFFEFCFKKLLKATENTTKRAEENMDAHHQNDVPEMRTHLQPTI